MTPILRKIRAISVSRTARVFVDGGASIGISVIFGLSYLPDGYRFKRPVYRPPISMASAEGPDRGRLRSARTHREVEPIGVGDEQRGPRTRGGELARSCAAAIATDPSSPRKNSHRHLHRSRPSMQAESETLTSAA